MFALALPVVLGMVGASVDYVMLARERQGLQAAADAAALAAARELAVMQPDPTRLQAVAEAFVRANDALGDRIAVTTRIIDNRRSVEVTLARARSNLFGALLGTPETALGATAVGTIAVSGAAVCVIALDTASPETLRTTAQGEILAPGCAVYSNSESPTGLIADGRSRIAADLLCSSGGFEGNRARFQTQPTIDCPMQPDPLVSRPPPPAGSCTHTGKIDIQGNTAVTLAPGVYCGELEVQGTARVTLLPGIYVIRDKFKVSNEARIFGRHVGFYMQGANAIFEFTGNSEIDLTGPRTGPMAGLLFYQDRTGGPPLVDFRIDASRVRNLTGTIYLPRGMLYIAGTNRIAEGSAYTAVVTRRLRVDNAADLVINTRYGDTDVPVPNGLGHVTTDARPRLSR